MRYSEKFKRRVFYTLSDSNNLDAVMNAMERKDHDAVRIYLSDAVDDIKLYRVDKVERDGSLMIREPMRKVYEKRKDLYNDFMIGYDNYLSQMCYKTGNKLIHD